MGKVKLGVKIVRGLNNISHAVGKHSPLILTAAGVVGLGATAVFSYKAAKKMEVVVEEMEEARVIEEKIAALTPPADLEEMEELAELQGLMEVTAIDRVEIGKKVIGVLALPVATGLLSIAAIAFSYKIQTSRITSLAAALTTAAAERKFYKAKYVEEYGEEKAKEFYRPTVTHKTKVTHEDGTESTLVEDVRKDLASTHGVWFDKSEHYISDDHSYNLRFIRNVEDSLTNKLFATGWLRMNEVFDALGLERNRAGELLGWSANTDGFNLECITTSVKDPITEEFSPQIYIQWSQPEYIYDSVEYKWS